MMQAAHDPAGTRPLCVQCRRCGRKGFFSALSLESRGGGEVASRLVCSACGGRALKTFRLSDDREAKRWMADR